MKQRKHEIYGIKPDEYRWLMKKYYYIKDRCYIRPQKYYKNVKVLFTSLDEFIRESIRVGFRKGDTIDRINPDKDYEVGNIRFIPAYDNYVQNRSFHKLVTIFSLNDKYFLSTNYYSRWLGYAPITFYLRMYKHEKMTYDLFTNGYNKDIFSKIQDEKLLANDRMHKQMLAEGKYKVRFLITKDKVVDYETGEIYYKENE